MCLSLKASGRETANYTKSGVTRHWSVMVELLWRGRDVRVVSSDVSCDATALAPPLVTVSSQTVEENTVKTTAVERRS